MTGGSPARSLADCRIRITHRTARWDEYPVTVADAADFWGAAASAANVIMQLSRPGVGYGVVESTTLQVTEDQWPPTRAEFDDYWTTACAQVSMDDAVRAYLTDLVKLRMINPVLALPFRPLLTFLTGGFLAPVFREAMGMSWGAGRQFLFEMLFLLVAFGNRFLPLFIRQAGSYLLLAYVRRQVRRGGALT
ncbi:MAG: oxygenase MpaB family protein [Mycobacterium sp.]|nr:oxygenase MpaB family protein [Mycobacterium sp.]